VLIELMQLMMKLWVVLAKYNFLEATIYSVDETSEHLGAKRTKTGRSCNFLETWIEYHESLFRYCLSN
jgi:hypothetical protein